MNLPPELDAEAWALRITMRWRASVEAIIEVGQLLIDAKGRLPHGEFGTMLENALPFGERTAQRLMAIAGDKRLSNPTHVSRLPASWGTLYELTQLSDAEFDRGVEQQVIRPDMERREIAARIRGKQQEFELPRSADGKLTPEARKALAPIIKEVRAEKQVEKKERRDNRELELGNRLLAMPEKKYGVAIEDFEWDHEPWSRETGMDRHPANHYPTSSDAHTPEEIVARTAERMVCLAQDCVLYKWTTIPHERIAHHILELRGFKYVTQRIWSKLRNGNGRGPGYWVTGEHEILLIAVRGKVVPPATAHFRSLFEAPVGEHSEKPDRQYEHAEYHFPNLPKIELNARRVRSGWDRWGFEAPSAEGVAA
jgi:N6-adenosine-specific RNA methylase IME4